MISRRTPPAAGEVDAWLDAEDHSFLQSFAFSRPDERRLVALQPEAVTGAVREELAVAGILDDRAGGVIDLLADGPFQRTASIAACWASRTME